MENKPKFKFFTEEDSRYRPLEEQLGGDMFMDAYDYYSELYNNNFFVEHSYVRDPLFKILEKLAAWRMELGVTRFIHEIYTLYHDDKREDETKRKFFIRRALEQVMKEEKIISDAAAKKLEQIDKVREENPAITQDLDEWHRFIASFPSEFESLQVYGYPLPYSHVFDGYIHPLHPYGIVEDNIFEDR